MPKNKFNKIFLNNRHEDLLSQAADQGDFKAVKKILEEKNIDINLLVEYSNQHIQDSDIFTGYSATALHCAADQNHHKIVQLLIDYGATIDIKNSNSQTAIDSAAFFNHYETVECLINNKSDNLGIALFSAVTNNNFDIAKLLIQQGQCHVNYAIDSRSGSPLPLIYEAIRNYESVNMLDLLIKNGADTNCVHDQVNLLVSSIKYSDDESDGVSKLTQYLLSCPKTNLDNDTGLSDAEISIVDRHLVAGSCILNMMQCEKLYKKSDIQGLYEFFKTLTLEEQTIFVTRQINKFDHDIKYFQTMNSLKKELKDLYEFVNYQKRDLKADLIAKVQDLDKKISEYYDCGVINLPALSSTIINNNNICYTQPGQVPYSLIPYIDFFTTTKES